MSTRLVISMYDPLDDGPAGRSTLPIRWLFNEWYTSNFTRLMLIYELIASPIEADCLGIRWAVRFDFLFRGVFAAKKAEDVLIYKKIERWMD